MLKIACTNKELSCIIGNLFVELESPCRLCEDVPQIVICGTTYTGRRAVLFIGENEVHFDGEPEDLATLRRKRCNGGKLQQ